MYFQKILKSNCILTGVLQIDLNLDAVFSFGLYKIRGMIISRKLAFLAAAVVLFKDFGCCT